MKKYLLIVLSALCAVSYIANHEAISRYRLRSKLANSVVMLTNVEGNSGGTGFTIAAPSGNKFILTNDHICKLGEKEGIIYANEGTFNQIPLKILYRSIYTDLCLVSPIEYKPALKLARSYEWGQQIVVAGHPLLYDFTMTEGELVQSRIIQVLDHVITEETPCPNYPKYKQKTINIIFFQIEACILEVEAVWATAQILPGNSGSVVADLSGNVVGIAFAGGDSELNIAWLIPLNQIELFLRSY